MTAALDAHVARDDQVACTRPRADDDSAARWRYRQRSFERVSRITGDLNVGNDLSGCGERCCDTNIYRHKSQRTYCESPSHPFTSPLSGDGASADVSVRFAKSMN